MPKYDPTKITKTLSLQNKCLKQFYPMSPSFIPSILPYLEYLTISAIWGTSSDLFQHVSDALPAPPSPSEVPCSARAPRCRQRETSPRKRSGWQKVDAPQWKTMVSNNFLVVNQRWGLFFNMFQPYTLDLRCQQNGFHQKKMGFKGLELRNETPTLGTWETTIRKATGKPAPTGPK